MSCETDPIYTSVFNSEADISTASIILISILLPIQLIIIIVIFVKGYSLSQTQKIYASQQNKQQQPNQQEQEQLQQGCCQSFCSKVSKNKLIIWVVLTVILFVVTVVMLILCILSVWQALTYTYDVGECTLAQSVNSFAVGDSQWIGLNYMTTNTTQLQLDLNTRVKVSKNAILGLLLNGTVAAIPPGIGFANGTTIPITNSETDVSQNTVVVTNNVESYIESALRQWLYRNSSLSGSYSFPVCQNSSVFLPHPVLTNSTIELDYMDSICGNLTAQVDELVVNGRAVDSLLNQVTSVESQKSSIDSNLTSFNATVGSISLRSNQYTQNLSSIGVDVSFAKAIPVVLLLLYCSLFILTMIYFCCQYRITAQLKNKKHNKIEEQDESQSSQMSSVKEKRKKVKKIRLLGKNFSKGIMIYGLVINILVGLSAIYYSSAIVFSTNSCISFENALTNETAFNDLSLTNSDLLDPIQKCTSSANTHFLQTTQTSVQQSSMQQLYQMSSLYNSSIPLNVFNSHSLQQIQILKGYLLHLETMPVKSQDFTLASVLTSLNTFTNGSNTDSEQINQCGGDVLKDQYIFNSANCSFPLIDYETEDQVTQPRCLQIPTFDGTSGTSQSHLNKVQHTIVLNGTCPAMTNFFDGSDTNCFLGKRIQLLNTAGCTNVASSYAQRVKNLVDFSIETGSYTDVYLQNLRNFFGIYAVVNTNLSQFFVGTNMSETLDEFGTLSNNLLNKTSCSYVKTKVQNIFATYCPTVNSIPSLFFDSFIWVSVALFLSVCQMGFFYYADYIGRSIFFLKMRQKKEILQENDLKSSSKKLEQSQQTLREEEQNRDNHVVFNVIKDKSNTQSQESPSQNHETVEYNRQYNPQQDTTNKKVFQTNMKRYRGSHEAHQNPSKVQNIKFMSTDKKQKQKKPKFFANSQRNKIDDNSIVVQAITPPLKTEQRQQSINFGRDIPIKEYENKRKSKNVSRLSKKGEEDKRLKIIQVQEIIERTIDMVGNLQKNQQNQQ